MSPKPRRVFTDEQKAEAVDFPSISACSGFCFRLLQGEDGPLYHLEIFVGRK